MQERFSHLRIIPYSLPLLLIVLGIGLSVWSAMLTRQAKQQVARLQKQSASNPQLDNAIPAEAKPVKEPYYVAPTLPKIITIPSIAVVARVRQVDLTTTGAIAGPSNIYDTAWFDGSAKPGDNKGAILIDGHVQGPTSPGVFYRLKNLRAGASITIERGDGKQYTFIVHNVLTTPASQVDMAKLLTSLTPDKLGLNLITCGGHFNTKTNEYDARIEVFATAN